MLSTRNLIGAALIGAASAVRILAVMLIPWLGWQLDYAPALATNFIIEHTPPDNAVWLQATLGPLALPSAILGGIMFVGACGAFAGVAYALIKPRSRLVAIIAASLIEPGVVAFLFPNMTLLALTPLLFSGLLIDRLAWRDPPALLEKTAELRREITRRQLLTRLAFFSVGGLALSLIDSVPMLISELTALAAQRKLFDFQPPAPRIAGFAVPQDIKHLVPEISPVDKFYVMRKFATPIPSIPVDWRLTVNGRVDHVLSLSLDDLMVLPRQDVYLTRQCISNNVGGNLISTAQMSGISLKTILMQAGISPGAVDVIFYGRDGYTESMDVAYALEHGLLVYGLNGESLPPAHGAPLRMEMPGLYGFKSLKWLDRIEVVDQHYVAIWESEGYTATPVVKIMSRIDTIEAADNGAVIAGIAFAGLRGIGSVEVQINDADWLPATLNVPALASQSWVQWRIETPLRGTITATVRATDGDGNPQLTIQKPPAPDGASGLHHKTAVV